jgi:hypothetical protein
MRASRILGAILLASLAFFAWHFYAYGQSRSDYPDGYDAPQAAPNSHKIIFDNSLVRVLEVTVPPPGATEPMHHHRWPSFFLSWDTGGPSPHVHYHRPDGSVRDEASINEPMHPGRWSIEWMKPEPMHAIEVMPDSPAKPSDPPLLRVEIKTHR